MGLFKPNWMSKDEKKGLAAATAAQDKWTLLAIAFETPLESVCLAAIDRMDDRTKGEFAIGFEFVQCYYDKKYSVSNSYYYSNKQLAELQALNRMTDRTEIAFIANTHSDENLRRTACHELAGDARWANIVESYGDEADALLSIQAVDDNEMLKKLAQHRNEIFALSAVERVRDWRTLLDITDRFGHKIDFIPEIARQLARIMTNDWDSLFQYMEKQTLDKKTQPFFLRQALAAGEDCPEFVQPLLEAGSLMEALKLGNQTLACMVLKQFREFNKKSQQDILLEAIRQAPERLDLIDTIVHDFTCRKEMFLFLVAVIPVELLLQYMQGDLLNSSEFRQAMYVLEKREQPYCDEIAPLLRNADKRTSVVFYLAEKRDRRAFAPLIEMLQSENENNAINALTNFFPCPETADALFDLLKRNDREVYSVEAALRKMYLKNRDLVGDHIKSMPLSPFKRSHHDFGSGSCHDDISAVTFDFLD